MGLNKTIAEWFEKHQGDVIALSDAMWDHPEVGMQEYFGCKATAEFMRKYGFEVTELDAAMKGGEPNCLVAKWGSGRPVIGIMGELDALPGLGQDKVPYASPRPGAGQGCGHNLMAACNGAAAIALKEAMEAEGMQGTVVYLGCPAEETFEGKVHMIHDGLFEGIDACLTWHPMQGAPGPLEYVCNACANFNLKFYGKTAHAGGQPENGRSALDAAELTNVGVQYLREHVTDDVRMHYIYTSAGSAPNIVPDYAELNYFVRAKSAKNCRETMERVIKVAEGAAHMTETRVEVEMKAFAYDMISNNTLNKAVYEAAVKIPEVEYTQEELEYVSELYKSVTGQEAKHTILHTKVQKPTGVWMHSGGSSDVGDVSWLMPTSGFFGLCFLTGVPNHHWNTVAVTGNSIGHKAGIFSAKVLAQAGYEILQNPAVVKEARAELDALIEKHGAYECWLDKIQ